jgi:hypothetical protein
LTCLANPIERRTPTHVFFLPCLTRYTKLRHLPRFAAAQLSFAIKSILARSSNLPRITFRRRCIDRAVKPGFYCSPRFFFSSHVRR